MKDRERWKRIRKMLQYLAFSLLFTLILGSLGISGEIPVSQAVQKQEETEQELPTGGVDEIRIFRMGAGAAEHVPSYENQLSFFSRTTSVFEAGKGDYGFNRLSDDQKAFYMSLEISLRNFENSEDAELSEAGSGKYTPFKVEYAGKNLDDEQAGQVWTAFQSDHPGLFWLSGYMVSFDGSGEYLMPKVVDEYKNDLPRIKKIYAMIEDGILDYLDAVSGIDNTYEKVRIIYDRIIHDVDYAYQSDGTTPEAANWAHSIVGVFDPSHKSTVCEGYAKTFSFLMNILDIPNIYIVGATESDGGGRHAWNAVSFNGGGSYYYMDATWDDIGKEDPDKPENLYIYFAMPRSVFEKRHFADGPESKYWQYGLPVMEDDMKRTYFKTYGAYGTGDTDWNDQSMKEFLKQAGALSTVHGRLILLVDTDTYDKIKTSLGSFWYYSYSKEDGYKVIWAEVPQSVLVTTPAKALTLSPTEISMDMNGVSKPLSATVSISSMTQNSDDYIQVSSSDEKVVTVDAPFVKAKQDWSPASIRLTGHSVGTATIYARSALGGVAVSCKVVVKPKVSPSSSPLPTPSNPPFSGTLSNPRVNSDGVITWDCVYFGNYWQEDTNGDGKADKNDVKTPIKWRVLSVDGDDVFLLADKNLDVQQYNKNDVSVTWETCTMRSWLNGYGPEVNEPGEDFSTNNFLHNAFSENEQSAIRTTNVVNDDNPEYGTEGGNDTSDKVYLLSINEVTNPAYGFALDYKKKDEGRRAKNTEYAKTRGAYTYTDGEYAGNGYWWLRSPGNSSNSASRVDHYGYAFRYGDRVYGNFEAARAALHLNLKASSTAVSASDWLYAGTVSSDGTENEVAVPSPAPTATAMPTKAPTATETPSVSHPPVQSDLANPTVGSDGITTWDCMYFGNYWQEDTNGDGKADRNDEKNPIKWRVLSVDGDDVFLMTDKILDAQRYNNTSENVTWETCTLRSWLNGTFLNNAFTAAEQSAIITTNVVNDDNSEYDIEGGNNTEDQVYLLSFDEVIRPEYGFIPDTDDTKMREAVNTAYVQVGRNDSSINTENWWLRSPGQDVTMASDVGSFGGGDVSQYGSGVSIRNGVRPVLHLSLKSLSDADPVLSGLYAGIVTSEEGRIVPTAAPGEVSTPKPTAPSVGSKLRNPRIEETGITTWDCVWFGEYWKDDTNEDGKVDKEDEKKPIKWRVLSVDGNDAFLLADQNLDVQKYHDADIDVTWEKCTMRSWLNGYGAEINAEGKDYSGRGFLNDAFTAREKSAIETTYVVNNDSSYYDTEGINNTLDQVYLLSFKETMNPSYGFTADYSLYRERRKAVNTAYVAAGGEVGAKYRAGAGKTDTWFLRSPGNFGDGASFVDGNGYMFRNSSYVVRNDAGVRPVLHLKLSFGSEWSYAGTVASDGTVTGASPAPTRMPLPTAEPLPTPSRHPFSGSLTNPVVNSDGVTTWDCIYFGNYWQEDTNEDDKADENDAKQPVKWRVLSVNGDDVFLLADKNLDAQQYSKKDRDVTWETSTMRSWLNGYGAESNGPGEDYRTNNFLNNAFSESEQLAIRTTYVVNNKNPHYGTEGGNNTSDKVYLLSVGEAVNPAYGFAEDYYKEDEARRAKNTEYAKTRGAWTNSSGKYAGNGGWWLRSPGSDSDKASNGSSSGYLPPLGYNIDRSNYAVRPALHLNLSIASDWSYAGTVSSDGKVTPPSPTPTMTPAPIPVATMPAPVTAMPTVTPAVTPTRVPPVQTFMPLPTVEPKATPAVTPSNSPLQKILANPRVDSGGDITWDCVYFGHYRQSDTNKDGIINERDKEEPIKWRILSVDGDDAFILADKSLDAQEYDDSGDDNITWETCSLRSWLNSTFYKKAFSDKEQSAINAVTVENKNNPEYGTLGGKNTKDNVFLLSLEDVTNAAFGFSPDFQNPSNTRVAKDTDYTKKRVMYVGEDDDGGFWWLRTPGYSSEHVIDVLYDGSVDLFGGLVWKAPNAVRPALHLNLKVSSGTASDSCWSYAGTVSSDGTENEVAAPSPDPAVTSAPTASPGIIPAATPTVNPTEEPEVTPAASLKPYETVTPDLNPTKEPTGQPLVTQNPQPIQQPAQVTSLPDPVQGVPSTVVIKSGDGEENDCDDDDFENGEEKLQRGDYFMVGNFGYKIMKLKGKKGEIAIVCVRSKKSKAYVIPGKVKKQGITFTVTSIQANAFKGCKKARKLTIKAAAIRNIAKKALNGLNKRIPVKVPAKKLWIYRKMLRKFGFRIVQR